MAGGSTGDGTAPGGAVVAATAAWRRLVGIAVVGTGLDLLSKAIASATLAGRPVDLPGPLDLRLTHNPGVAFSLGRSAPAWLILALSAAVTVGVAVSAKRGTFASPVAGGLILAGALGNLIDRAQGGAVVDLFDLGWWPTFNLADVFITVGVGLLVLTGARPEPGG